MSDCDDYKISGLGLERSDIIVNKELIQQLCETEKKMEEKILIKSKFLIWCNEEIELVLTYKNENECVYNTPQQDPQQGKYSSAYTSCCKDDCKYILKIDKHNYNCKEVYIHLLLSNIGIAPTLYEVWKVKNSEKKDISAIFIMQKLDNNLYDLIVNLSKEEISRIYDDLIKMLTTLYQHKIKHGDLHLHNIMTDSSGKLYLIDFGLSSKFDEMDFDKYLEIELSNMILQLIGLVYEETSNGTKDKDNKFMMLCNKMSSHYDDILPWNRLDWSRVHEKTKYEIEEEKRRKKDIEDRKQRKEEQKEQKELLKNIQDIQNMSFEDRLPKIKDTFEENKPLLSYKENCKNILEDFKNADKNKLKEFLKENKY